MTNRRPPSRKELKAENERRFWDCVPVRPGFSDAHCWIWTGPVFRRRRTYINDVIRPYLYARKEDGRLSKTYANIFAWQLIFGEASLLAGDWLMRKDICEDELCVNPYHFQPTDPGGFYHSKFGTSKRAAKRAAKGGSFAEGISSACKMAEHGACGHPDCSCFCHYQVH